MRLVLNDLFEVSKNYEFEDSKDLWRFEIYWRASRRAGGHFALAAARESGDFKDQGVFSFRDFENSRARG